MNAGTLILFLGLAVLLILIGLKYRQYIARLFFSHSDITEPHYSLPAQYPPQVATQVKLPDDIKGLVGIRQWNWVDNVLTSRNNQFIWTSNKMVADKIPEENNLNGIYAYQLGSWVPAWPHHIGIVEMLDHIEIHADGVLRAEKCRILFIIVNWGRVWWAREISSRYNIPVYVSNYPEQSFRSWLLGPDGMRWLNHNFHLIHGKKFEIIEEAEKLLGAKNDHGRPGN